MLINSARHNSKGREMNIINRMLDDVTILDLEGNLALEGNLRFRKQVAAAIEGGARKLLINFEKVQYMDSSGLGEVISCYTSLLRVSGRLKLLHMSSRLLQLLIITRLNTIFETFDSEPAALASFAADQTADSANDLKPYAAPIYGS